MNRPLRFFVVFFVTSFPFLPCFAQKKSTLGIYFTAGKQATHFRMPTLETLINGTNSYYYTNFNKSIGKPVFKNYKGISLGAGFLATAVGFDVNFGKQDAYTEGVFNNGDKLELQLNTREFEYDFNFFLPMGFAGRLGPFFGFNKNTGELKIGYRYADGDLSYGPEKPLTGIYRVESFQVNGGLKFMLGYKWVNFFFKAGFNGLFNKSLDGDRNFTPTGLKDDLGGGPALFSNIYLRPYLPQEIMDQFNSTNYLSGTSLLVTPRFRGWKFQLGIAILIARFKEKEE